MRTATVAVSLALITALSLPPPAALAAWGTNPATNLALCTAPNDQFYMSACSDGAGGAIVAWSDFRTGAGDIYVQRVSADGTVMWGTNGTAICTMTFSQWMSRLAPDGAGGAYVTWSDGRSGSGYDIYAQRVDANGAPQWTPDGVRVCSASGSQSNPAIGPDGAGGAIVAWVDARTGPYTAWAQRIAPDSTMHWADNGVQLAATNVDEREVHIATDGQGGAVFAWTNSSANQTVVQAMDGLGTVRWGNGLVVAAGGLDRYAYPDGAGGCVVGWQTSNFIFARRYDQGGLQVWSKTVYVGGSAMLMGADQSTGAFMCWTRGNEDLVAQHLDALGDTAWSAAGALVVPAPSHNYYFLHPDAEGGAAFVWSDYRTGTADVYAQRLDASGARKWSPSGAVVCTAASSQFFNKLVPSVNGGWIVVWEDFRNGNRDIYCQNVDRNGFLGDATPAMMSVTDVPGDDGGMANVQWSRSYLDRAVDPVVVEYRVLRQTAAPASGTFAATGTTDWEVVATVPATTASTYVTPAPTDGDDIGGSHPITTYRVEAHGSPPGSGPVWSSGSMGGWSLNNLPPPVPATFEGVYRNGATVMRWDASPAADIGLYRLYRGSHPGFVPGPGSLLTETTQTTWSDYEPGDFYYRLSAVDVAGNESASSAMQPWTTGVDPAHRTTFGLEAPKPHPVRGTCSIHFVVPRDGPARLSLFDVAGRLMATLHDGPTAAGPSVVSLDVDRAGGRELANGLYLLRLEADGRTTTRRLMIAR